MSTAQIHVRGVDYAALPAADYERAARFYRETLGLPFGKSWGSMPAGEYETGNLTLAVMQMDAFGLEFQPHGGPLALRVDDVHAARAALEAQGVEFVGETIDSGVCHQAIFHDTEGNTLILHHRYKP